MLDEATAPRSPVLSSVGSRISWGAIFAGAVFSLGLYSLLTILGGAVGVSISERMTATTLKTTAIVWALLTILAAIFVGGVVTSQFTVGETKTEAMLYGVIMWALLFGFLATMSAAGVGTGLHALAKMANVDERLPPVRTVDGEAKQGPQNQEAREAATRLMWYAFIGTWLSMIAAAAGAVIGAGSRFKVVTMPTTNRITG